MATQQTLVTAFVASPGDVSEERAVLQEVVNELNLTWSKTLGIRLDFLGWETHTFPAVGKYPQEVINRQIGDDYDIFIGIMWKRFGTATPITNLERKRNLSALMADTKQRPERSKSCFTSRMRRSRQAKWSRTHPLVRHLL
jgi:hypothetical protein